ncbi:hypothetical protein AMJ47_00815 [Parcubacteria bacterium DG_72]|nr:MAG: hypothetical protein AMJ47_00815 [Parcubacteria bacterium DG_72]
MTTIRSVFCSEIKEDWKFEIFMTGVSGGFIVAIILGLIFLIITLFFGFSLKIIILLSLIAGVFFSFGGIESIGLHGLLGCGLGSGFATFLIFSLRAGLKQGLTAGIINLLLIFIVFFCINAVLFLKDICLDLYYKYR